MIITPETLAEGARAIDGYYALRAIKRPDDLLRHPGVYPISGPSLLEITERPSQQGTRAIVTSYVLLEQGIPLEVRFNTRFGWTQFFVKVNARLKTYRTFGEDWYGNLLQSKQGLLSIATVRDELRALGASERCYR